MSVHRVNDATKTEIHTAEPLEPETSSFEAEIATEKLRRYKSTGRDQIPAELILAREYILRSTNLLVLLGIRKNCHSTGRNLLLHLYIRSVIKLTVVITEEYHCYQLNIKLY
jgi:hypothetical protein